MNSDVDQVATEIIGQLEGAWNKADAQAYGVPFTEDADFVNIRGDHFHTRKEIAEGHQYIFDTIYKESVSRIELMQARKIDEKVIVAHANRLLRIERIDVDRRGGEFSRGCHRVVHRFGVKALGAGGRQ